MALSLSNAFIEKNTGENKPVVLVEVQTDIVEDVKTTSDDFSNNESASNVDFSTVAGQVSLSRNNTLNQNFFDSLNQRVHMASTYVDGILYILGGTQSGTSTLYEDETQRPPSNSSTLIAANLATYDTTTDTYNQTFDFLPNGDTAIYASLVGFGPDTLYIYYYRFADPAPASASRFFLGTRLYEYTISTKTFTLISSGSSKILGCNPFLFVYNNNLYLFGHKQSGAGNAEESSIFRINRSTGVFTVMDPSGLVDFDSSLGVSPYTFGGTTDLTLAAVNGQAAVSDNFFVAYGFTNQAGQVVNNVYYFPLSDLDNDEANWEKQEGPSTSRTHGSVMMHGNTYYFAGGVLNTSSGTESDTILSYVVGSGTWTTVATFNSVKYRKASAQDGQGTLWAFGGTGVTSAIRRTYSYNVAYASSGQLQLKFDLGETPAGEGEWQIRDRTENDTNISYSAQFSSDDITYNNVSGSVQDGNSINEFVRYFIVTINFTSDSERAFTPILNELIIQFSTYTKFSNQIPQADSGVFSAEDGTFGNYEPSVLNVSSLSTSIDFFEPSSVGQLNVTIANTKAISSFLYSKFPRNKIVRVKLGLQGIKYGDYLDYFYGQIYAWRMSSRKEWSIAIQDYKIEWDQQLSIRPSSEVGATPISYNGLHPQDVQLDILQNQIDTRSSKIDVDSFLAVKAEIPGTVTRTITEEEETAKALLEELRLLTATYFIPDGNGIIKIKRFDPTATLLPELTEDDFLDGSLSFDSNSEEFYNRTLIYYGWDGDGEELNDFAAGFVGLDPTSIINNRQSKTKEILDRWSQATTGSQLERLTEIILARYANIPSILTGSLDFSYINLEVADQMLISTTYGPSENLEGIVSKRYEIVSKTINLQNYQINFRFKEVVGGSVYE
jgi:hypothetical protein